MTTNRAVENDTAIQGLASKYIKKGLEKENLKGEKKMTSCKISTDYFQNGDYTNWHKNYQKKNNSDIDYNDLLIR